MFKNQVSEFIYKRTYSRWLEEENRREDWPETIERFISFIISERPDIPEKTITQNKKVYDRICCYAFDEISYGQQGQLLNLITHVFITAPLLK